MRFMVLVLAATPLARWGWPRLARYRRMLGLYAWFYATLHLLVFAQVYIGWSGAILLEELAERPYVLVGFLAWLILVPLGITSANSIRRKMGRNWRKLHKLTYAVAILGWLHLLWLSRSDIGEAVIYGAVFVFLFALRIQRKQFLKSVQRMAALIHILSTSQPLFRLSPSRPVAFVAMCKCPKEKSVAAAYL